MWCVISCSIKRENNAAGDFLYSDYVEFFEKKGIRLAVVPNAAKNPEDYFDICRAQGLILSGGNDLGAEPCRDRQEALLMDIAIRRGLPVLGICRGMQFINKYFGGSLPKPLAIAAGGGMSHVVPDHPVKIVDAELVKLIGRDRIKTNSFHRQGFKIEGVSPKLKVVAVSEEGGVVEAVRHQEQPIMGVQWHPERKSPEEDVNDIIIELFKSKAFNRSG